MGERSVVAFSVVDREKAVKEALSVFVPTGPGGLSHRVLGAMDYYCVNPACDCKLAHLDVFVLEGEVQGIELDPVARTARRTGDFDYKTSFSEKPVRLNVDIGRGTAGFPEGHRPSPAEDEVLTRFRRGLSKDHLDVLKRHYEQAKAWGDGNYWRYADWSHLREGVCVGWAEVFPKAQAWLFEAGGKRYAADDQYCISPSCDCREALINIIELRPRFWGKRRALDLGCVGHDLETGRHAVHALERGRREDLLALADALFSQVKDLPAELRRRRAFMRDFGRHVAEQVRGRAAPPQEARSGKRPSRNAPCPCGSGKKYKKCCLGGEPAADGPAKPRTGSGRGNADDGGRRARTPRRIERRAEALESLIRLAAGAGSLSEDEQGARMAALARRYGAGEIDRCLAHLRPDAGHENMINDGSVIYRSYRRAFALFGGTRPFFGVDELNALKDEYSRLDMRRRGFAGGPPLSAAQQARLAELADLTLMNSPLCDDLVTEDRPPRPGRWPAPEETIYTASLAPLMRLGPEGEVEPLIHGGAVVAGHAAELLCVVRDDRLLDGWPGDPEAWAPMHAVRALGLLRASACAAPLLALLGRPDDWITDLLADAWAAMGPEAAPALWRYAKDPGRAPRARGLALDGLARTAQRHPGFSGEAVAGLAAMLEDDGDGDREAMGYVVFALGELKAAEAWPAVERAFDRGSIDEAVYTKDDARRLLAG